MQCKMVSLGDLQGSSKPRRVLYNSRAQLVPTQLAGSVLEACCKLFLTFFQLPPRMWAQHFEKTVNQLMQTWFVLGLLCSSAFSTIYGAGWPFTSNDRINNLPVAVTEPKQRYAADLHTHHQLSARLEHKGVTVVVFHQVWPFNIHKSWSVKPSSEAQSAAQHIGFNLCCFGSMWATLIWRQAAHLEAMCRTPKPAGY